MGEGGRHRHPEGEEAPKTFQGDVSYQLHRHDINKISGPKEQKSVWEILKKLRLRRK